MNSRYYWLLVVLVGWMLLPLASAAPKKQHKAQKDKAESGELVTLKDIPSLPDGPDKKCYAVFHGKAYDALVLARDLSVRIYIKDKDERIDKPIEINNHFLAQPDNRLYKDLMVFKGFRNLAPPAADAPKLVIMAENEAGVMLVQTWKFADNKIVVENSLDRFTAGDTPMRTFVCWPRTHKFTPNVEQAEREKAVAGYTMRWRAGKNEGSLRTITVPYAAVVAAQPVSDWVENEGPWGARKVTIKRLGGKGTFTLGRGAKIPYGGLDLIFTCKPAPKAKGLEGQGFELKVE